MDFESADPKAILDRIAEDQNLFAKVTVVMFGVYNFDNRLPKGLKEFHVFFAKHAEAIFVGAESTETFHRLFREWLKEHKV